MGKLGEFMRFLMLLALAAPLIGCATAVRGTNNNIQFDSEPSGAEVRTVIKSPCDGPCPVVDPEGRTVERAVAQSAHGPEEGPACVTPCQLQVKRNQELIATITKPGYAPVTVEVKTKVAGEGVAGMAGGVVLFGLAGGVVDVASGAMLEHEPNPVKVQLRPLGGGPPTAPPRRRTGRG
jgi:hypothetical protein